MAQPERPGGPVGPPPSDELELENLRAAKNAKDAPKRGQALNTRALMVLRQRVFEAKTQGSANVAISVDLLIELLSGTLHAEKHGFQSELTV